MRFSLLRLFCLYKRLISGIEILFDTGPLFLLIELLNFLGVQCSGHRCFFMLLLLLSSLTSFGEVVTL
jgi:hypothetical protein